MSVVNQPRYPGSNESASALSALGNAVQTIVTCAEGLEESWEVLASTLVADGNSKESLAESGFNASKIAERWRAERHFRQQALAALKSATKTVVDSASKLGTPVSGRGTSDASVGNPGSASGQKMNSLRRVQKFLRNELAQRQLTLQQGDLEEPQQRQDILQQISALKADIQQLNTEISSLSGARTVDAVSRRASNFQDGGSSSTQSLMASHSITSVSRPAIVEKNMEQSNVEPATTSSIASPIVVRRLDSELADAATGSPSSSGKQAACEGGSFERLLGRLLDGPAKTVKQKEPLCVSPQPAPAQLHSSITASGGVDVDDASPLAPVLPLQRNSLALVSRGTSVRQVTQAGNMPKKYSEGSTNAPPPNHAGLDVSVKLARRTLRVPGPAAQSHYSHHQQITNSRDEDSGFKTPENHSKVSGSMSIQTQPSAEQAPPAAPAPPSRPSEQVLGRPFNSGGIAAAVHAKAISPMWRQKLANACQQSAVPIGRELGRADDGESPLPVQLTADNEKEEREQDQEVSYWGGRSAGCLLQGPRPLTRIRSPSPSVSADIDKIPNDSDSN